MHRMFAPAILLTMLPAAHAQNMSDMQALAATKLRVSNLLSQVPDYACLETIERDSQDPRAGRQRDVVRVDVVLVSGKESFSWPGQAMASTDHLRSLVGYGLTATGLFGGLARNLFVATGALIRPPARETLDGLPTLRYDFSVPETTSAWTVNWAGVSGDIGERGSFWVDGRTLRLLRLEVNGDEIPPNLTLTSIRIVIDYSAGTVSGTRVLIPSAAEVWTQEAGGGTDHNRIFFSQCRKFTAESALVEMSSTTRSDAQSARQPRDLALPAGLEIPVELADEINSAHAAVGDPVRATVTKDILWKKKNLIPQGTVVIGHLRRFELVSGLEKYLVAIEFDQVQTRDGTADFFAKMQSMDPLPGLRVLTRKSREAGEAVLANEIPGVSTFVISGPSAVLPAGMRMCWKTEDVRPHLQSDENVADQPAVTPGKRNIDSVLGIPH